MYYSKSTNGFYHPEIHGTNMPTDVVEITQEHYRAMLEGQAQGKCICSDENGCPVLEDAPAPTVEEQIEFISAAVQKHLDDAAKALGYDDIRSAVSYADEPAVAKFQAEGQALRRWRSLCWGVCCTLLEGFKTGETEIMTPAEVIAKLPTLGNPHEEA